MKNTGRIGSYGKKISIDSDLAESSVKRALIELKELLVKKEKEFGPLYGCTLACSILSFKEASTIAFAEDLIESVVLTKHSYMSSDWWELKYTTSGKDPVKYSVYSPGA